MTTADSVGDDTVNYEKKICLPPQHPTKHIHIPIYLKLVITISQHGSALRSMFTERGSLERLTPVLPLRFIVRLQEF